MNYRAEIDRKAVMSVPGRTLRQRGRRLTTAVLVVVLVLGAALGAMQAWPRLPWWAMVTAAALAGAADPRPGRTRDPGRAGRSQPAPPRSRGLAGRPGPVPRRPLGRPARTPGRRQRRAGDPAGQRGDRLQPTDALRPPHWEVLAGFELVTLDRDRDRPADHDLRQAIPDRVTRERVARIGVGEYVGAAQQVRDRLELGAQASPLGYALVLGAVDWRLAGIARPVPADLLPRLAAARLSPRHRAELGDPDAAEDDELLEVGFQTWTAYDLPGVAERAWRLASDVGDARATSNLGALFQQRGQPAEAEALYRRAAEAGDTSGMNILGAILVQRSQPAEAEAWFRKAARAGDPLAVNNSSGSSRSGGRSARTGCARSSTSSGTSRRSNLRPTAEIPPSGGLRQND